MARPFLEFENGLFLSERIAKFVDELKTQARSPEAKIV
jgi:hypothetical protein